jgi:hypothetical protein
MKANEYTSLCTYLQLVDNDLKGPKNLGNILQKNT